MVSYPAAGVLAVAIALVTFPAHAAGTSEAKTTAGPAKSLAFDLYNCSNADKAQTSHLGQVVAGVYVEWMQSVQVAPDKVQVTCVTTLKPSARQLGKAEAATLLTDAQKIGQASSPNTAKPASAAVSDTAVSAPVSAGSTILPLGVAPDATSSTPATNESVERTAPQQLIAAPGSDKYAVVDAGYGRTLASASQKKAAAASVARPASIGTDDRLRVGDTTISPWSLIGQVVVTWKDGTQSVCTGTLVSQYVVLTAGQCGHNRDRGGFPSKASFAPGQYISAEGTVMRPFGMRNADYVETNNRWTQISGGQTIQTLDARSDYAAFYFGSPWSFTSTFMPIKYADNTSGVINTAGYPTEAGGASGLNQDMWYSTGAETSRSASLLRFFQVREYSVDVSAGENGAPLWSFDGTTRSITGLVSYGGDDVVGGVWFGGENTAIVTALAGWTPSQASPVHVVDNLRVPLAVPSGDQSSDSYIMLYNPTAQSGTVSITFNDGETGQQLGTWISPSLLPFTSVQFRVVEMEQAAGFNAAGHSRYTLQMAASFPGFFQEILWNRVGISLTNISGCGNGLSNDVIHLNNVHSSLFADYPSVVLAHNVGSKGSDAILGVYDAQTGQRLGGVIIPSIPGGASAAFRMNEVEAALGFAPKAGQFHYNLVQEGDFPGYMQHLVYNTRAGLITNMTAKCAFPLH